MPKITLADLTAEPTTFDFAGHTYTALTFTKTVEKKFEQAQKKLKEHDDDDTDGNVLLLCKAIETLFDVPEGAPALGKALADAWKADEIGIGQLHALYDGAQEAALARPTSRRQS